MTDSNSPDTARRRELLDAIGKASELHHHMLLVLVVLIGAQGIVAARDGNLVIFASMVFSVLALGTRLWVYQDQLASMRMRLKPLLDGEDPTPDAKTKQELDWLTQQDPWLERASVWGLWLSAALFAGGCVA